MGRVKPDGQPFGWSLNGDNLNAWDTSLSKLKVATRFGPTTSV
jgi:hypothetical protein